MYPRYIFRVGKKVVTHLYKKGNVRKIARWWPASLSPFPFAIHIRIRVSLSRYCFLGFIALVSVSFDLGLKMDQVLDKMAVGCLTRVRFARKHQRLKTTFRSQETLSHFMSESDALEVPAYQSSTIANCVGQSVH